MKAKTIMAAAALGLSLTGAAATMVGVSTFDDIHYWVGEGTNRCAIVIDFFGGYAWAWGYRWNGEAPNVETVLKAVVEEDHRLTMVSEDASWGLYMQGFGYDVNDSRPKMDFSPAMFDDQDAVYGMEDSISWTFYVNFLIQTNEEYQTEYDAAMYSNSGVTYTTAAPGEWYVMSLNGWMQDGDPIGVPQPAETPYGYEVVGVDDPMSCWTDCDDEQYNVFENVLGRPVSMIPPMTFGGWTEPATPVTPATPIWGPGKCLTLESADAGEAYVTIAFDHDVIDDPKNPFGIDFIVYGNSGFNSSVSAGYYTRTDDPNTFEFGDSNNFNEQGLVEVSQDGETWYSVINPVAPRYADDFPTLGFVYDAENPDTSLFSENQWWGKRTDACLPVDPRVTWENASGLSLGEIARRFNGSAGGTGFDLANADGLPVDEKGRKWFRYVRISNMEDSNGRTGEATAPEVDAVADVAPVSDHELWVLENYGWANAWDKSVTGKEIISTNYTYTTGPNGVEQSVAGVDLQRPSNGRSNAVSALLDIAIDADPATALDFVVEDFLHDETANYLSLLSDRQLSDTAGVVVKGTSDLAEKDWPTLATTFVSSRYDETIGRWRTVFSVAVGEEKFFKLATE